MPNPLAPVLIQATDICASAVIVEAYLSFLSFLGAGAPPDVPSWGNIMAEGRSYPQLAFWSIFFPGLFIALSVLAINLVGDGLRDSLDVFRKAFASPDIDDALRDEIGTMLRLMMRDDAPFTAMCRYFVRQVWQLVL